MGYRLNFLPDCPSPSPLTSISLPSCVCAVRICYSYHRILFCNFTLVLFTLPEPFVSDIHCSPGSFSQDSCRGQRTKYSSLKVWINVCRGWMQTWSAHRRTHTHTVRLSGSGSWSIAEPAEQTGSFIMIAAGISGHNYQRRLIHSLIASFNLFTFGGEQCQPACSRKQFAPRTCNVHDRTPS